MAWVLISVTLAHCHEIQHKTVRQIHPDIQVNIITFPGNTRYPFIKQTEKENKYLGELRTDYLGWDSDRIREFVAGHP